MKQTTKLIAIILSAFMILSLNLTFAAPVIETDDVIGRYVDDIFFRYDANDDQYLDRQEARLFFMDASGKEHVQDNEYTAWFRLIDANKDGKLSWNEIYVLAEAS